MAARTLHTHAQSRVQTAFTLLETIVILVVLSIVASVAAVAYLQPVDDALNTGLNTTLKTIDREARAIARDTGDTNPAWHLQRAAENLPGYQQLDYGESVTPVTNLEDDEIVATADAADEIHISPSAGQIAAFAGEHCRVLTVSSDGRPGTIDDCNQDDPIVTPDRTPPTTPTNLVATATAGQIDLTWDGSTDSDGTISYYRIYRNGQLIDSAPGGTTAYTDAAVQTGTTYSYTVDAVDNEGLDSAESNTSSATP